MNAVMGSRDRVDPGGGLSDIVGRAEVEALIEPSGGPLVSIFLQRHGGTTGAEQDRIAFRNLLVEAQAGLERTGSRAPDARRILTPALDLLRDPAAWERPSEALALYVSTDRWLAFRLPIDVRSHVDVSSRFHVRPLLPMLFDDGRFYVLALSQNRVRLFVGTREHIQDVALGGTPTDLDTALRFDELEPERLYHVSKRDGVPAAVAHGRGIGGEVEKVRLTRFLRLVDDGVVKVLRDERAPLVLAGSDPAPAIYRRITRYPAVLNGWLPGNPDRARPDELHRQAWPLVEPTFRQQRIQAAERFRQLAGTGRTTEDVEGAVAAASSGRVEVLFVWTDAQRWGSVDDTSGKVSVSAERGASDVDLLELAAVRTLLSGGVVYAVPSVGMPDGEVLAAILRY
ncbi:MAG TPA: hypothetical protein VF108_01230 [Actinomycetota bacterium]